MFEAGRSSVTAAEFAAAFVQWKTGVLAGLGAINDSVNTESLWAWGNAESDPFPVMHINNPLDTTQFEPGAVAWNTLASGEHVWIFASVADGINATVATLLDGRYPIICDHLRNSVPRQQWGDACAELGVWGTGCGWLQTDYGPPPGGFLMALTDDQQLHIYDQLGRIAYALQLTGSGILADAPTPPASTRSQTLIDLLAAVKAIPPGNVDTAAILAAIADLKAHPSFDPNDATILSIVQRLEAALKSA